MGSLSIFSKFNRYIIYTTLSALFSKCIYGLNYNEAFIVLRISGENFSKNIIIHKLFSYFGTILFGLLFYKIEIYSSRRETSNKQIQKDKDKDKDKSKDKEKNKTRKTEIELIYIDTEEELKNDLTFNFISLYLLIIFIWIIEDQLIESFYLIFQDLDFWMIELFIICYLNSMVFKVQIFNHQKVAILFGLFSSLLKVGTIILSFYDDPDSKYGGKLPIYYIKNYPAIKIVFGIVLYLILILLHSIVNLSLKWYMDIKYISPNQILICYGILGTIIYIIFSIIITQFKCEPNSINDCNVYNYICKVKENDSYYIDSFNNYFSNYNGLSEIIREIIVIILGIITFFLNKYFSIMVIKYLSPVHVIFSVPILFMLEKIVMISNTLISRFNSENNEKDNHIAFFATDNSFKVAKFCLDVSGDIFSLTGFLIYLEIIRLKCGQMNYNIKTNIIKRGDVELMIVDDNSEKTSFSISSTNSSTNDKSPPGDTNALFRDSKTSETSF